jgi:hypothetical protein
MQESMTYHRPLQAHDSDCTDCSPIPQEQRTCYCESRVNGSNPEVIQIWAIWILGSAPANIS